ncbi:MAG: carbohydrate ABC transporter permease [Armatimonadota bacterium]|nr:carbohydrate ABC transporter permease [Armatimonadota bacterium]MDR7452114.1 carbohydrate ABC transporter permease [Armatimonadota bacterium]MDR7467838.1 carbohydrate ABC transporter permease [Armatimonadota bacterium]MDR7494726.1 carbohydrate ABC transporter permease [Armatimonadota bacterium]MDR7499551.1 carbohydrate ABC transporter permease [Armatimonadota bacterium]
MSPPPAWGGAGREGPGRPRGWAPAIQAVLLANAVLVLAPMVIMTLSAFKSTREIFQNPFGLPVVWRLENFGRVWVEAHFALYFRNSLLVTAASILIILAFGAMAGYALGRFRFGGGDLLYLYFLSGLMLPVRLGIIPLFILMRDLRLLDTLWSLILIYAASGLPSAVFILTGFFRALPGDLDSAARIDGAGEWLIFRRIMLPLVRPALVIVTVYNLIPVWNDFFFPLVFIQSDRWKTLPLGMTAFFGQYYTDWATLFAGLTLAAVPVVALYAVLSQHFIRGLTAGAVKG